jgi:hypothetical protein
VSDIIPMLVLLVCLGLLYRWLRSEKHWVIYRK